MKCEQPLLIEEIGDFIPPKWVEWEQTRGKGKILKSLKFGELFGLHVESSQYRTEFKRQKMIVIWCYKSCRGLSNVG